jgi:hypothetical protein
MSFEIGDRVKFVEDLYGGTSEAKIGMQGTVVTLDGGLVLVDLDELPGDEYEFEVEELELIV